MGMLGGVMAANAPAAWDDYWYQDRGLTSYAGVPVTADKAMTLSHVYACTAIISEDVAKVPKHIFEDLGEEGKRAVGRSPKNDRDIQEVRALEGRLEPTGSPNDYQTGFDWFEMMTAFAVNRGKGVSEIRRGRRPGFDDQYVPLHPDLVNEITTRAGVRKYEYRDPLKGGEVRTLLADEVVVMRGRFGRGVLDFARDNFGNALALQRHVGQLWSRGARFQGVITHPKILPDTPRENLRKALDEYRAGGEREGRPLLLEDGMTWANVSLTSQQAELVDSQRMTVVDGCRYYRVPPHKVFELERSTNNNIERQSIDYVVDSVLSWTNRWEGVVQRDLIIVKGRFFLKINLDGLMRGDFKARSEGYAFAIQWGWLTPNEVREMEDRNPMEGAGQLQRPLNMEKVGPGAVASLDAGQAVALRGRLKLHASDAAARVIRREIGSMGKLAERSAGDSAGWRAGVEEFYADHVDHVARALHVAEHEARGYADAHRAALLEVGPIAMADWLTTGADELTRLALEENLGTIGLNATTPDQLTA